MNAAILYPTAAFIDPARMSDTRQTILDTAVGLVAEQGVRAVSFREVARRAGLSHQAPYHHFGSHHGILEAIAREGFRILTEAMQAGAAEGANPLEALTRMGVAYVRFATSHLGHFRVMFQQSLVDVRDEAQPIEEAAETYATLREHAGRAWETGHGRSLDPEVMAHLCWSVVHGLATLTVEGILAKKTEVGDDDAHAEAVVVAMSRLLDQRT